MCIRYVVLLIQIVYANDTRVDTFRLNPQDLCACVYESAVCISGCWAAALGYGTRGRTRVWYPARSQVSQLLGENGC